VSDAPANSEELTQADFDKTIEPYTVDAANMPTPKADGPRTSIEFRNRSAEPIDIDEIVLDDSGNEQRNFIMTLNPGSRHHNTATFVETVWVLRNKNKTQEDLT
jgi:hypothetical protein